MKNQFIIPSIIIAAAILGVGWMLKPPAELPAEPPKAPYISLYQAAYNGDIEAVKQHMAAGSDVNAKDNDGYTPLHWAAREGRKEVAELLIAKGADVNAKDDKDWTPLHFAPSIGQKELVELLIAKCADVNARDYVGRTPLDIAAIPDDLENKALLRKHGGKTRKELKAEGK